MENKYNNCILAEFSLLTDPGLDLPSSDLFLKIQVFWGYATLTGKLLPTFPRTDTIFSHVATPEGKDIYGWLSW
jgi:hypothetical protein